MGPGQEGGRLRPRTAHGVRRRAGLRGGQVCQGGHGPPPAQDTGMLFFAFIELGHNSKGCT